MAEEIRTDQGSRPDPLSVLWRVLATPQTLLILAGLLALALIVASLIPQIPPQAMDDPQAWLATQPGPLSRRGSMIRALGLYDLFHALWFRLLLALAGLVLFVRLVDAVELAWNARRRGAGLEAAELAWEDRGHRVHVVSSLDLDEVQERLGRFLARHGYRYSESEGHSPARWMASRWPGLLWMRPASYAALLLAAAGLVLSGYWGWESEAWRPLPGDTRLVGYGTPYVLRFDGFEMQRDGQGRLEGYASQVTWLESAVAVQATVVTARRPVSVGGVALRQVGYLPVVQLQAWDGDGNPLALESGGGARAETAWMEIRFESADEEPVVYLPAQERLLALVFEPMCRQGQPALYLDSVSEQGNGRRRLGSLTASGEVTAHDLQLQVELFFRPVLRLDRRPGMGLVVAGMSLASLALFASWLVPSRLISFLIEPWEGDKVRIHLISPPGARVRQWLAQIALRLEGALADGD